jgi:hypothetical protein
MGCQNNPQWLEFHAYDSSRRCGPFGEVPGGDTYQDLLPHSFEVGAFGVRFKCINLPTLILIKEAAGRSKDREAVAELRVLLEESQKNEF